jgi:hypothetical protein
VAVNVLLSYAYHSGTNLADVRRTLVCGRILIDSGAFTAHSTGKTIKLDDYAAYLEQWKGCWDHAVTLDVVGDPAATAVNTRKLHAKGIPVMPVFTRGDKLPEFDAMVRDVGYVCVGGLVGLPRKVQVPRVGMLQRRAQDAGGGIHALGIAASDALRAIRPYSADASSVGLRFRYGDLIYFDGRDVRFVGIKDRAELLRNRDNLRAHGIDIAPLVRRGRMPNKAQGGIDGLMQAMSIAYAAADECLKRDRPVPAPKGHPVDGTHLYNSVGPGHLPPVMALDRILHGLTDAEVPGAWRRWGYSHTCRRTAA